MSKPHVYGSFQESSWNSWVYDTPLFSKWIVGWQEPAGCGHESCGVDWLTEEFATWTAAIKFALALDTQAPVV